MSTYANITIQQAALRLLRYVGVTSLIPQPYGSELEDVTISDLGDAANAISAALQEIASVGPLEAQEAPMGGFLNAPTSVTVTATQGSTTISALTTWAAWMQGCTIRLFGDSQDNELLSATQLVRPYMATSAANIQATVYGDTITLDARVGKIVGPVWLGNRWPLVGATNREDFMQMGLFPMVTFSTGFPTYSGGCLWPYFYQKAIGIPRTWFIDAAYDMSLGYTQRRIRMVPLPDQAYPLAYTAGINPPRITVDDIVPPSYQSGAQIVVTGITGTTAGNQTYVFFMDLNGQPIYRGVTTNTWFIYPSPALSGNFILSTTFSLIAAPSAYWASGVNVIQNGTSTWTATGSATGAASVTPNVSTIATSDPGTVVPIPNAWVESILLPIALKYYSATPLFKNESLRPEIDLRYRTALAALKNSKGQEALTIAHYV